jgi:4-hydroxy-2-oxoheptanedioate aldolase
MRVNKVVELLASSQPAYFEFVDAESAGGYDGGRALAQTWADYITYDMEHSAFDVRALTQFMRGLVDGGPTRSGHRTPAVIVTLPLDGIDAAAVRTNSWMIKHVLGAGVHGLLLCHTETPEAVRSFVEAARYAFKPGVGADLGAGRRGHGGQIRAAEIWGIPAADYFVRADPWPLNPQGELLLGIKVENTRALDRVEQTTKVPGLAFAEWGPGDMGMSMGYPDQHDEPYPAQMQVARASVMAACKSAGLAFLEQVTPLNVTRQIDAGVMLCAGPREAGEIGRKHSGRKMPW